MVTGVADRIDGGALTFHTETPFAKRREMIAHFVMLAVVQLRDLGLLVA